MSQELSPDPATVAAARERRRAFLLDQWAQGKRLAPDDLALIEDLITAARTSYQAGAAPASAAVAVPPAAPDLALEYQPDGKEDEGYRHTYAHYAATLSLWDPETKIDSRVRQIKRWVQDGREHSPRADLPPLDQPEQLAAWWTRVRKRRVPAALLAIAAPPPVAGQNASTNTFIIEGKEPSAPPSRTPDASQSSGATVVRIDLSALKGTSTEQNLQSLRVATEGAFNAYEQALAQGSSDVETRRRAWNELNKELRQAEKAAEEILLRRGELISRGELRTELRRVHATMAGSLRTILLDKGLKPQLADSCVAEFFRPLREGKFVINETAPDPLAA